MYLYNAQNIIKERIKLAEEILADIPTKYCFISGSFLYKEKFNDIDVFVISRTKKTLQSANKKVKITIIDFNDLYSLFYHSISKSCIAKSILPEKPLKVTTADYWQVLNEAVPTLLNEKKKYHKDVRFLILYTEYFKTRTILDSFELNEKIGGFKSYKEILDYIGREVPAIIKKRNKKSYLRRFFYTQAGYYKDIKDQYDAQNILYNLTHAITRGVARG